MIQSYVEIYRQSNKQQRLEIIKRFLEKMFPQFDFSEIDSYDVIFTRDKYQFYVNKRYVGMLQCDDWAVADLAVEVLNDKEIRIRCYDQTLNKITYDLLEIEDAHR